jgi:hypothetical protein
MELDARRPMNVREWKRLRKQIHDDFYADLVTTAGCGAFDGGCLVVAQALQKVIGGDIVVIIREDGTADHAAVLQGERLWDYAGPLPPVPFISRLNLTELRHLTWICTGYRPIESYDLEDAYRDDDLAHRLSEKFGMMLSGASDEATPGAAFR